MQEEASDEMMSTHRGQGVQQTIEAKKDIVPEGPKGLYAFVYKQKDITFYYYYITRKDLEKSLDSKCLTRT